MVCPIGGVAPCSLGYAIAPGHRYSNQPHRLRTCKRFIENPYYPVSPSSNFGCIRIDPHKLKTIHGQVFEKKIMTNN